MRTSTAAWAAALAVLSMRGPFTTAEAAPARRADHERRRADHERLRPIYPKLKKRQGFNDTEPNDRDPLGLPSLLSGSSSSSSVPARADPTPSPDPSRQDPDPNIIASILGQPESSSSSFPPPMPLTSSASLPTDSPSSDPDPNGRENGPADPSNPFQRASSQGNAAESLLSSLLHPTGNSRPQASDSGSSSEAASSTDRPGNDPLLGSITGALSNAIPPTPSGLLPSAGTVTVGITTVLHQSSSSSDPQRPNVQGTGNSRVDTTTQSDNGILPSVLSIVSTGTGNLGSVLTKVTGAASLSDVLSSVKSDASPIVPSGVSGLGSGITGTGPLPTITAGASILSSVQSEVTQTASNTSTDPGIVPAPLSSLQSSVNSRLSVIKATATDPAIVSSAESAASSILTSAASTLSNPTATLDSITSDPSPVVTVTGGTGNAFSTPAPAVFTITREGTSVVVSVPTNTGGTSDPSPIVTAPPESNTITSSFNASDPTASATDTTNSPQVSPTALSSSQSTTTTNDTAPARPNTSPPSTILPTPPTSTTPPAVPPPDTTDLTPQVSIVATATDAQTSMTLPTVWTFAPTASTKPDQGPAGIATAGSATVSSPGGFPTAMPRLVQPAGGMPDAPANFTLVQVGFSFGLNYPFVVSMPESATQIFAYLPQGIAYGLGISKENVLMNALMPYDTSQSLGYITTLAQTYIPSDLANQLQLNLHAPASPIYYNPSDPVKALMDMVNPTIPILPGAAMDGSPSSSSFDPAATTGAVEGDGAPIGGDASSSKKVTGATVGIGAGAIAGAAVYAAAMIYVARRYRQKRKGHQRASSVPTAGEMTQRSSGGMGGFFMSGANGRTTPRGSPANSGGRGSRTSNGSSNGRSVREQGISAPLMSENSLGWN